MRELKNVNLTKLIGKSHRHGDKIIERELDTIINLTKIPLNNVDVFEYYCNRDEEMKMLRPNSFLTYFFVKIDENCNRELLKVKRGNDNIGVLGKRI